MSHHVIYPQLGCHSAEVFNAGWDDDPNWKAVCDCGWEVWNCSTQELAEDCHNLHARGEMVALRV